MKRKIGKLNINRIKKKVLTSLISLILFPPLPMTQPAWLWCIIILKSNSPPFILDPFWKERKNIYIRKMNTSATVESFLEKYVKCRALLQRYGFRYICMYLHYPVCYKISSWCENWCYLHEKEDPQKGTELGLH